VNYCPTEIIINNKSVLPLLQPIEVWQHRDAFRIQLLSAGCWDKGSGG
jgi:hypothetical protein